MSLVQIDLRRTRADAAEDTTSPAAGDHAHEAPAAETPVPTDSLGPAVAGLPLAGGLILLAPVAAAASTGVAAFIVLLIGLTILGMLTALLRPTLAEVDRP